MVDVCAAQPPKVQAVNALQCIAAAGNCTSSAGQSARLVPISPVITSNPPIQKADQKPTSSANIIIPP